MPFSADRVKPIGSLLALKRNQQPLTDDLMREVSMNKQSRDFIELEKQAPVDLLIQDELSKQKQKKTPKKSSTSQASIAKTITPKSSSNTDNEIGTLSRRFEALGPGTVSTGKGDKGGVSYGSYQFATNTGSAKEFVRSLKETHFQYYSALSGAEPGTPAFSAAWKKLAARDPDGFFNAQHDYIKAKMYDVSAASIKVRTGLDLKLRSATLRDVVWSTAVQFGPVASRKSYAKGRRGAADILEIALKGRDPATLSDDELIQAIYAERGRKKANGTLVYFSGSSKAVQAGVSSRYGNELQSAVVMLKKEREITGGASSVAPSQPNPVLTDSTGSSSTTGVRATPVRSGGAQKMDVWVETKFISQYSTQSDGDLERPSSSAAGRMASERRVYVRSLKERIQVATAADGRGGVMVDSKMASLCLDYIDEQLGLGRPVVAGVCCSVAHADNSTLLDLYVLIAGRGISNNGAVFYAFQNPTARAPAMGACTNPDNRFYVEEGTRKLYRPALVSTGGEFGRRYEVALVVRNF